MPQVRQPSFHDSVLDLRRPLWQRLILDGFKRLQPVLRLRLHSALLRLPLMDLPSLASSFQLAGLRLLLIGFPL
jgi:hypothetical protein